MVPLPSLRPLLPTLHKGTLAELESMLKQQRDTHFPDLSHHDGQLQQRLYWYEYTAVWQTLIGSVSFQAGMPASCFAMRIAIVRCHMLEWQLLQQGSPASKGNASYPRSNGSLCCIFKQSLLRASCALQRRAAELTPHPSHDINSLPCTSSSKKLLQ